MLYDDRRAQRATAQLDAEIGTAAERARTEEDFRIGAVQAIRTAAHGYGLELDLRAEMAIAAGRADAAYNRVVIELKRPGTLRQDRDHRATASAIKQVQDYLESLSTSLGVSVGEFAGIVTDGRWYVFVRNIGGSWIIDGPLARNPTTTGRFLRVVLSLGTGRALTAANLVEDFGIDSAAAAAGIGALYRSLFVDVPGAPLRDALFGEWERLFGAISGVDAASLDRRARRPLAALARHAGVSSPQPARLLFCIHTYFALVTKFVAYAAVRHRTRDTQVMETDLPEAAIRAQAR